MCRESDVRRQFLYTKRGERIELVQQIPSGIVFGPVEGIAAWFGFVAEDEKGETMNDDKACEIIRLLDSIDTTLREVSGKLDPVVEYKVAPSFSCTGDSIGLEEIIRGQVRRELRSATVTDILVTPETDDDKQGLSKWLEQLDKCQCPIQVRIVHEDCCERRE